MSLHRKIISTSALAISLTLSVGTLAKTEKTTASNKEKKVMTDSKTNNSEPWKKFVKPADEVLKKKLTPEQYSVTQHEGTEPPFKNTYWDNHEKGIYVDVVSGEPLFLSTDKYDSGTGWPSFTRPIKGVEFKKVTDRKLMSERTEVRSAIADSHLGHVFPDGPQPTGLRYCMNSASLRFIPFSKLEEEGYGQFKNLF